MILVRIFNAVQYFFLLLGNFNLLFTLQLNLNTKLQTKKKLFSVPFRKKFYNATNFLEEASLL